MIVDLFPYKIKKLKNFINRKHPHLHPHTFAYKDYWKGQLRKFIEGEWVNDEGTWVFMMPKLYFYINMGLIVDTDEQHSREIISPKLRDTEWIVFTYLLCCQGFSGFENDPDYTCNLAVKKLEDGENLNRIEKKKLTASCYKEDGSLKKYVEAWHFLTEFYLLDNPRGPLGRPVYDNDVKNFILLGGRGLGKTYSMSVGDAAHEFLTAGIKFWEDIGKINKNKIELFIGAADADKAQNFSDKIRDFFEMMPGQYDDVDGHYNAYLHKNLTGSWAIKSRSSIKHRYKIEGGRWKGSRSEILFGVFTVENPQAGVGIRPVRIYCDEFGLLKNALEVHGANVNSLKVKGKKHGMAVYLGTGGNIVKVQEPKIMFYDTVTYDVFGIENKWEGGGQIGLFIPATYGVDEYKDENGNTLLEEAQAYFEYEREKLRKGKAREALDLDIMNNPLKPSEMFIVSGNDTFPKEPLMRRLAHLQAKHIHEARSTAGKLEWNGDKVRFVADESLRPITTTRRDLSRVRKEGAIMMIEEPPYDAPERKSKRALYKVVYDPVRDEGGGTSFASILVYKGYPEDGNNTGLTGTIVAYYLGRYAQVDKMHEIAIQLAVLYNCKVLHEDNIPGFKAYCKNKGYVKYLQKTPRIAIGKLVSNASFKDDYGVYINPTLKVHVEQLTRQWLLEGRHREDDKEYTNMDFLYVVPLLEQLIDYRREGNFDMVSALFLLALWLYDEASEVVVEDVELDKQVDDFITKSVIRKRGKNVYYDF